jgi:hypothetical protein
MKTVRRFEAQQSTIIRDLQNLMRKIGATSLLINSPNLLDPKDVAASITFDRVGKRYIAACSRWKHWLDNLRAAQLAIEYTYRIAEAYGVQTTEEDLLQQIFAALEAPLDPGLLLLGDGDLTWYGILGVPSNASKTAIVNAYRALARVHHPDVGGKKEDFLRLKKAYEDGLKAVQ